MVYMVGRYISVSEDYVRALEIISTVAEQLSEKMDALTTGFIIRVGEVEEYTGSIIIRGVLEVWIEGKIIEAKPYALLFDFMSIDKMLFYLESARNKEYMMYRIIAKFLVKKGLINEYSYRGGYLVLVKRIRDKDYVCIVGADAMMIYVPDDGEVYGEIDVDALLGTGLFTRFAYDKTVLVPVISDKKRYAERGILGYKVYFGRAIKIEKGKISKGYFLYYVVKGMNMKGYIRRKYFVEANDFGEARDKLLKIIADEIRYKIENFPQYRDKIMKDYTPVLKALGISRYALTTFLHMQ